MIRAFVQLHAEVDQREAGEHAARGGLLYALVDGGDELRRDGAADDLVGEQIALAARQRCHADPAVAELALAAGLLLVPPLPLLTRGDRLAVGDLRLRELAGRAVLPLEPRERDVEVALAHTADDRLARVGHVLHGERGVLVVQPV